MTVTKDSNDPTQGAEPFVIHTTWLDARSLLRQSAFWALTSD